MITVIAGGKKPTGWQAAAIAEYEKRLRKPYDLHWRFLPENKFAKYLASWPFTAADFVIVCDERGQNISSHEYANLLQSHQAHNHNIIILIGGAYGFDNSVTHTSIAASNGSSSSSSSSQLKPSTPGDLIRARANFLWSISALVLPHALARLIVAEQTYRAQSIALGHPYHHA